MTITIDTIAGNDVVDALEAERTLTLTGVKSQSFSEFIDLTITNSAGTIVYSRTFEDSGSWSHTLLAGTLSSLPTGTYTLSVAADDIVPDPTTRTFVIDATRPTVTSITLSDTVLWPGDTALVTFQFSEAVTSFTAADVVADMGSISNFTVVDADTYTAIFTPDANREGEGTIRVRLDWADAAGNAPDHLIRDFFESAPYDVDRKPPTPGVLAFFRLTDTGSSDTPIVTSDNDFELFMSQQPTDSGSGGANSIVQRSVNGGAFQNTGNQTSLPDGTYHYRALHTDFAGGRHADVREPDGQRQR
jgi:hypothetical protein